MRTLIIFFIFLFIFTVNGSTQIKEFTVNSSIKEFTDSICYLTIWNGTSNVITKTIHIKPGQVLYQDTTSVPLVIRLGLANKKLYKRTGGGAYSVPSQFIWFVALPDSKIDLQGHISDFAEVYPSGGTENETVNRLNRTYHPLVNKSVNIAMQLDTATLDKDVRSKLIAEKIALDQNAKEFMIEFIKNNASSIFGLFYLDNMLLKRVVSDDFLESILPTVQSPYTHTAYYQTLSNRLAGAKFQVGKTIFPIRTTQTYDKTPFSTEALKGKFYLIDFWGSWCAPCLADVPALKSLKKEFPNHLEVVGIASDKEPNWRKAIEQHQLNWAHILNGIGESDFVSRLNVTGFPTKILIDPSGKIVYRNTGGGNASFDKMKEIIKAAL